jgi:hypothetical protein
MTPQEKAEYKIKAKQVIFDYITKAGYPNITNDQIMQHLPNMYRALGDNNLLLPGLSYNIFQQIANEQFFIALISGGRGI